MSPDEEPVENRTGELRKDHSQKERTGFIAVASNWNAKESTYRKIISITGTYVKDQEDDTLNEEDSLGNDGEKDEAAINLADAMSFHYDEGDDFTSFYSLSYWKNHI